LRNELRSEILADEDRRENITSSFNNIAQMVVPRGKKKNRSPIKETKTAKVRACPWRGPAENADCLRMKPNRMPLW
jgi:hypothetical protein